MPARAAEQPFADSASLFAACRSGDPPTQEAAYRSLWSYLYRVALQILHDQADAQALAEDCAQAAIIRVHERQEQCREPAAFLAWARRIAAHAAIDELRRLRRLLPANDDGHNDLSALAAEDDSLEASVADAIDLAALRALIARAPISDRSRRAVAGRYLDGAPDERLARAESELAGRTVLPSHLQVTRTKDIAKLRDYAPLRAFLDQEA